VDGTLYYVLGDHLGSTSLVADAQGSEVGHAIYDVYGAIVENTLPPTLTNRLFSAQPPERSEGPASRLTPRPGCITITRDASAQPPRRCPKSCQVRFMGLDGTLPTE
jgi:hypothetical protein